jgi:hypothetical protein
MIDQAGKVLANWHDPRMHVSAPTLEAFVTSDNEDTVEAFCQELFGTSRIPNVNTELKPVRDVLVASLLRYYDEIDEKSLVSQKIRNAAIRVNVSSNQVKLWGQLVKDRFMVANAQNFGNTGGTDVERLSTALTMVQKSCAESSAKLLSQEVTLTRIEANQREEKQRQLEILSLQKQILMRLGQGGSPLKRKASSSIDSPTAALPVAASSSTSPGATSETETTTKKAKTSANEEMMKEKAVINWRVCDKWQIPDLIEEILKSNMDVESDHFIPTVPSEHERGVYAGEVPKRGQKLWIYAGECDGRLDNRYEKWN